MVVGGGHVGPSVEESQTEGPTWPTKVRLLPHRHNQRRNANPSARDVGPGSPGAAWVSTELLVQDLIVNSLMAHELSLGQFGVSLSSMQLFSTGHIAGNSAQRLL